MKNILGTEEDLELFNNKGVKVYKYFKAVNGYCYEYTYNSKGYELTCKRSDGFSSKYTRDAVGKVLTYEDSNGLTRGFDKTYSEEEVEFIKRAVEQYWELWNASHPDNQNDFKLTKQILSK